MRVTGIGTAIPSKRVSNDDVIRMIASHRAPDAMSSTIERSVLNLFKAAGSDVRYYREQGELPRTLVEAAMRGALREAELTPADVDLLIYCGVGRGFLEPGNAYFCAQQLGTQCACFDISDACMGWLRAAEVAYYGMSCGRYENVLIVGAEFGIYELFAEAWRVRSPLDLRRLFAAYTLGEAASATVLSSGGAPWTFHYRSRPDLADLCTFPLPGFQGFAAPSSRLEETQALRFSAYSAELFAAAEEELGALLKSTVGDFNAPDLYVPHSASSTAAIASAERLGVPVGKLYADVMPRYGNVVSASVPLALRCALDEKRLRPGDDIVLCPASAGLSVAVAQFTWNPRG